MAFRILLAGALLLAASIATASQSAPAAPPPAAAPSIGDVVKDMSADQQQAAIAICGIYIAGAVAMLKRAAAPPPVPAGKQISI